MKTPRADRWLALLVSVGLCALGSDGSIGAEEAARPVTDKSATARSGRGVIDFPVAWSAPDRVVVPLKIQGGLPTVSCSVNGVAVPMIVDTGSQESVLEAETGRAAGVRLLARAQAEVEVTGARGIETARVGIPDSMSIGAWRWQGIPCVVRESRGRAPSSKLFSPPPVAFNILGMSTLRAMCSYVTIDYPRREVVFGFRQTFQPPVSGTASHQAFELRNGLPFVKVVFDGREWTALLDTGASSAMEIDPATATKFALRKQTRWGTAAHNGLGEAFGARPQKFEYRSLESVDCLGRNWRNVEATFVDSVSKVGSGLCRTFCLTVDFATGQLWLEKPAPRGQ